MRVIVLLDEQEANGLARLAREELRGLREQLRHILRLELARRDLWSGDGSSWGKPEKEGASD